VSYSESNLTPDVRDRRRFRPSRHVRRQALAALAAVALFGACGSNAPSAGGTGNNTNANLAKAVQFSRCMRTNGVANFPDPDASGQLTIDQVANGSGVDTNSAVFQQALSTCRGLEPAGFTGSKRSAQQQEAALKFAQCMRDNGVTDFPDPAPDAPLIDTRLIPSTSTSSGMDALHAAMRKCSSMAAAAGVTGGR
jgi:hypothetical protein